MAWQTRRLKRYYTRSLRIGGKVVRRYYGAGLEGHLAAALIDERKRERAERRQAGQALRDRLDALDQEVEAYAARVTTLVHAALVAGGYHLHARATWRRRRHGRTGSADPG
jgi:hypothetical protein